MTKKEIRKEKWTLIYQNSLRGMLGGLFSCVPFFPVSQLDRLLHRTETKGFDSFLSVNLPYLLFASLCAALFFFIPVDTILEQGKTGIYVGLLVMIVISLIFEGWKLFLDFTKKKGHIIASSILFILILTACILFYSFPLKEPFEQSVFPFVLMALIAVGSFFCSFVGISPFTALFFAGTYLSYSKFIRTDLYQGISNILFYAVIIFVGFFIGNIFARYLEPYVKQCKMEKHAISIAVSLSGLLMIAIHSLKAPWLFESDTITPTAMIITILTTIFGFTAVSVVLSSPDWVLIKSLLKKEKRK